MVDLFVSSLLSMDKFLWELYILMVYKCVVFSIDYVLGDGVCLSFMLMVICSSKDDVDVYFSMFNYKSLVIKGVKGSDLFWLFGVLWGFLKVVVFILLFLVEFVCSSLFVFDEKMVIMGGDGVEFWLSKLVIVKFLFDDINVVKKVVLNFVSDKWLLWFFSYGIFMLMFLLLW